MIYFLLFLSVTLNLFLFWFIYRSIIRMSDLVALIEDVQYKINFFSNHIKKVYDLEMFYGDPTLEGLLEHSRDLIQSFEEFNQDYALLDEEEEDDQLQEKA